MQASAETSDARRWRALAIVCAAVVVVVLDNTILNVALPTLATDLGADMSALQWIVDSYSVVFAAFVLVGGTVGDRWGRRKALIAGLVVFGIGSLGAATASTTSELITFRVITGLGSGIVFPSTLAIITEAFRDPSERAKAIGIWSAMAGIGVALGPVAGGTLLRHFWWGSVFIVNVPIVVACIAGAIVWIAARPGDAARPIDVTGAALSAVGIGAVVFAIIEAPVKGWSDPVVLAAAAGAVTSLVAFVAWERRAAHPMLDLSVFGSAAFSSAAGGIAAAFFVLFGTLFLMTQQLQAVLGYDALKAGLATMPMAVVLLIVSPASPLIAARIGTSRTVVGGLGLMAAGCIMWTGTPGRGYLPLAAALTILSVGIALVMAPATEVVMSSLPPARAGIASAVNDATREVGGALGVAVAGSVAAGVYRAGIDELALEPGASEVVRSSVAAAHAVLDPGRAAEAVRAVDAAFGDGVQMAMTLLAAVSMVAAAAVWKAFRSALASSPEVTAEPLTSAA